jgi:alanyl-tRNA synthetase
LLSNSVFNILFSINMTGDEIRKAFLTFFEGKGHTIVPSSPLIPQGDPTLLLTTAGMVQMKPYFLGLAVPPNTKLTSCQKCFRVTDIDSVGDNRHLTFFEMLGNFSVGDYFKKEAIEWGWEFVTGWLRLPHERLWITIFQDDDEAMVHWRRIGVPTERIIRLGEKQNFWGPAGDSGPCGPCSEIHYDFGPEFGCGRSECGPDCDCGRFSEIWNLVFMQFNQDEHKHRTLLPKPNIDTGMGLERVAAIKQGKRTVYETDLFASLVAKVEDRTGRHYGRTEVGGESPLFDVQLQGDEAADRAIRVISEHCRGITFLIADGVMPSNEGRGYVLRRLLRRTALFGRKLGLEEPFIGVLADFVIEKMGHVYPELRHNQDMVRSIIDSEETRTLERFKTGVSLLENTVLAWREQLRVEFGGSETSAGFKSRVKSIIGIGTMTDIKYGVPKAIDIFLGGEAFQHTLMVGGRDVIGEAQESIRRRLRDLREIVDERASDTDWPPEPFDKFKGRLTKALADMEGAVSTVARTVSGFEAFVLHDSYGFLVELTQEVARDRGFDVDLDGFEREMERQRERARAAHKFGGGDKTDLKAYEQLGVTASQFVGYEACRYESVVMGLIAGGKPVDSVSEGDEVEVVLKDTPFYAEMGGQVGDTGEIHGAQGKISVRQTIRPLPDLIVHQGKVVQGRIAVSDSVVAEVDTRRRLDIARNHTATHLLQSALRVVLGQHVRQSGSMVTPDRFRFDFNHLEPVGRQRLLEIQRLVNEKIRENLPVAATVSSYKEAVARGATALFGEKYGDEVRMVQVGDPPFSRELCGGTHVHSTGEIGLLHIVSEESVGSGLRRIEAMTGRAAERLVEERLLALESLAAELQTMPEGVEAKVSSLVDELDRERKRASAMERESARKAAGSLLSEAREVNGIKVISTKVAAGSADAMREMGDRLKEELKSGVVVLGAVCDGKPSLLAMVTLDLVAKGFNAGQLVKEVAKVVGGGGGGKAELGQGSGKDASKLDEALSEVARLVERHYDKASGTWKK